MKKRIEKNCSDSSSSVGFFPKSCDSSLYSSTISSTSGYDGSDDLFDFVQNNPVKINCWRENICSDLVAFTRKKIQQSAVIAPLGSPKKTPCHSELIETNKTALVEARLQHSLFSFTPEGQELQQLNQRIAIIDAHSGRSYQLLMDQARRFAELLDIKGLGNCEMLFEKYGVQNALDLARNIKAISPVILLMFLYLIDKYPTFPQDKIMAYFKNAQQQENSDCYDAFKFLDIYCYERYPTKRTVENYTEEDHLTATASFSNMSL